MVKQTQLVTNKATDVHSLYQQYGGMLLGYIFEVVKDMELAESYVIRVFSTVANRVDDIAGNGAATWLYLRRVAQNELSDFLNTIKDCDLRKANIAGSPEKEYFKDMTEQQRHIFCSIYYHKIPAAQLATELDEPVSYINKTLKEAFTIIKQRHDR